MPNLHKYMNWTHVFDWYVVTFGLITGYQKDTCLDGIGLCVQNMRTIIDSTFNIPWRRGGGKEEKLYDHLMNTRSLTLTIDRYRSSWDLNITRKVKSDISKHWFECLNGNDNRVDYTNFIFAPN